MITTKIKMNGSRVLEQLLSALHRKTNHLMPEAAAEEAAFTIIFLLSLLWSTRRFGDLAFVVPLDDLHDEINHLINQGCFGKIIENCNWGVVKYFLLLGEEWPVKIWNRPGMGNHCPSKLFQCLFFFHLQNIKQ
jgi:hypothetical protein